MTRVSGPGISAGRLWRIAVLTAAGAVGTASEARAALYYWSDFDSGYYRVGPIVPQQRRPKIRRNQVKKLDAPDKESTRPQGPLIIAISIEKQNLKIYDANGFYAATPISTGMRGHPTPMGVFSVIQKHKFHHSNIYSGAPMPYMQRITWSGVAMHAGVLPGYPASHGCIRMPMAFAMKMWNWTKMGARVVVTPGEMTPASFSHPLLATQKVVPQPAAANEPSLDARPADKAANAEAVSIPAISDASLQLRVTVGHNNVAKSVVDQPSASTPLREQTHTADVSRGVSATKDSVTMSDAAPAGGDAAQVETPKSETSLPDTEKPAASKPDPTTTATTPKRAGQIAAFISRKDSKLYVRQNFAPLFEVPVTISPGDRPLGTHVFTARVDKADANVLHWSVVSLPMPARYVERRDEDGRASRRRKNAGAVEVKALPVPNGPAEALDRLSIPADAMARITEALSTGASIIVSDQGIAASETGDGTDFIVSLR